MGEKIDDEKKGRSRESELNGYWPFDPIKSDPIKLLVHLVHLHIESDYQQLHKHLYAQYPF